MVAIFDGVLNHNAIAINWRPSSVCKLFQKSSPLKPMGQFKPNWPIIILIGFSLKVMFDDPAEQPSWPPCLLIEHGGKIYSNDGGHI
jgi:hypothetical protein